MANYKIPHLDSITPAEINKIAEDAAKDLKSDKVKTNQIRNVYSTITKIRQDFDNEKTYQSIEMDLIMLKPKVAYAAGRQPTTVKPHFYPLIKEAVEAVESSTDKEKATQNFLYLMESVVAYHKFYDPSN
jgi:CRISPR-associated protein Csm2